MNILTGFRLLIVDENELTANRFAELVGSAGFIIHFWNEAAALRWLADSPPVNLIIADKQSVSALAVFARQHPLYKSVAVLTSCRATEVYSVKSKLRSGVTDILNVNEEDNSLYTKLRYYLALNARLKALPTDATTPTAFQLAMPWWKRGIDISVSLGLLLLLSPLLLLVALLIRLDSRGPILYRSKRAGTNFQVFNMYKFRTMNVQADQQLSSMAAHNIYAKTPSETSVGELPVSKTDYLCSACRQRGVSCQQPLFDQDQPVCEKLYLLEHEETAKFMKFRNDPRITRLGTLLRNSSIDELPQLLNILRGDMSLVGNRPLPLYEAERLTANESVKRFAGPAGLTGIWQVRKRANGEFSMSDRERILLDIEYADTFSFRTDVQILWKTFFSVWQKENV